MESLKRWLAQRESGGLLRRLSPLDGRRPGRAVQGGREYVDFSSNDYLGLSHHPDLIAAASRALESCGVGTGASRLMSGDLKLHHALEEEVAAFKGRESALVFNSGYQANTGVIPALVGRHDVIFADRLCHASQFDGAALSRARLLRFAHNDVEHLQTLLERERTRHDRALILTESVFSMDGDLAPLRALVELKERHRCLLMVDEAHATGVFGRAGRGLAEAEGVGARVDVLMGTFSKALGGFGAYLAAARVMTDYLVNSARSFIYSTSLPAAVIAADLAALAVCRREPGRGPALLARAEKFRAAVVAAGWSAAGSSQIVPVMVGESAAALRHAQELLRRGFRVLAVRPPSVPEGTARLRLSICQDHSEEDLSSVAEALRGLR